ncbi:DUF4139 domain-containing protein [bacterium]|nr:MAG: DUF4139 domain-containing protein [bacterium]
MRRELPLFLIVLAGLATPGCTRAIAQTTQADPTRGPIELTVYAGDFAMVRETRKVELQPGRVRVGLQGVSQRLDQNSVLFNWPSTKDAKVVSSTYDLGTQSSGRLLERFLGQKVELVYRGQDGRPGDRIEGILQVAEPGNVVVKTDDRYIVNPDATIEAPTTTGIVTIPQLSAEVESKSGGATDLAVSYMTGGLSWNADYTVTLAPDRDQLGLECWATVTNKTGTDFPDAKLSFVAGSPNRVLEESREYDSAGSFGRAATKARALNGDLQMNAAFNAPQRMGELYAYPYKSTATIRQDQMNRVRMMGSEGVNVKRVYSIALPPVYREYASLNANPDQRLTATLGINFTNAKTSGLGLPLPAGAIRVYEPDATGAVRYVGAASIGDTPQDAKVSLELTNVFDIYARARQTGARRIDKRRTSRTVEVVVSNEKAKATEVRLVEPFGSNWKIASETDKSLKLNSSTNSWTLTVPAGGEKKLRYTVILGS